MTHNDYSGLEDRISVNLKSYAQNVLVVIFGLLPILFIPRIVAPFEYTKMIIVITGIMIALVLFTLSILRSGVISVGVSYTLVALWTATGLSFVSSILSGDFKDSLIGDLFSVHSTVFVLVLALVPTVWVFLKPGKESVMRLYVLLAGSTLILVIFHLLRILFGTDVLSLGVFTSNTSSPVGSWNDLALFLGLTIIIALIALEQLSLTKVGRGLFIAVTVASLFMLGVINFFMVWVILGVTSLAVVVYSLGKDRFAGGQLSLGLQRTHNSASLFSALIVFATSVVFFIGGASLGSMISDFTKISYVEVRPSFEATADVAKSVYADNALLGIGTNKFSDAWRLYRDDSINQTRFWNTDFNAGNGYVTTFFVTTGVLGGCAWIAFILIFFITGIRKLLGAVNGDRIWYFIAVSSFVSALYVWVMSILFVPGVVILVFGALCTGISLSALNVLSGKSERTIGMGSDKRTGFILTLGVITIIIVSVSALYGIGRHYSSVYAFNESTRLMQQGRSVDELERQVEKAFLLSPSDAFARRIAAYQIGRMNTLVTLTSPTQEELQQFQNARERGIFAAEQAIQIDNLEPANWAVLGGIYGILAAINIEGAYDRAIEAFTKARELDPKNPLLYLEIAIVDARAGNFERAREYIGQAIAIKSNFTEAFFLLSQLEIAAGNVERAIQSTQAVITLEPQNPARYYQLGVLEVSRRNLEAAIPAFERAVALDTNYANARYLLALSYDEIGRSEEAKAQLEVVRTLNPNNTDIAGLITVIQQEGSLDRLRGEASKTVNEATPRTDEDGTVSTSQAIETPLVTSVNTVQEDNGESTTRE